MLIPEGQRGKLSVNCHFLWGCDKVMLIMALLQREDSHSHHHKILELKVTAKIKTIFKTN